MARAAKIPDGPADGGPARPTPLAASLVDNSALGESLRTLAGMADRSVRRTSLGGAIAGSPYMVAQRRQL